VNPVLLKARIGASLEKKRLRDQQKDMVRRFATPEVAQDLFFRHMDKTAWRGTRPRRTVSNRLVRWRQSVSGAKDRCCKRYAVKRNGRFEGYFEYDIYFKEGLEGLDSLDGVDGLGGAS